MAKKLSASKRMADFCLKNRMTKSEFINLALDTLEKEADIYASIHNLHFAIAELRTEVSSLVSEIKELAGKTKKSMEENAEPKKMRGPNIISELLPLISSPSAISALEKIGRNKQKLFLRLVEHGGMICPADFAKLAGVSTNYARYFLQALHEKGLAQEGWMYKKCSFYLRNIKTYKAVV